ncbi:MAG: YgjV family protein [Methanobrevibacter sp.]|nr:YgjV family protein [Methanobrevibacter sp.]
MPKFKLFISFAINVILMNLATNIIIGNGISLFAGIFLIISYYINDAKKAYFYQFLNAFILAISSVFFFSWVGITTMLIAAIRNLMVYYDRLTRNWTAVFLIVTVALGLYVNTLGFVGLLPVIAVVEITLCNFLLKSIKPIKLSFIINSLIYIIYFFAISDFTSVAVESFTALVGAVSLIKLIHDD